MTQFLLKNRLFLFLFPVLATSGLKAQITPNSIFTDNMVLQQQAEVPIWGEAAPNSEVNLQTSWDGKRYSTDAAADGNWKTIVKTPKYGGPYEISFGESQNTILKNILIGDVWLCSGQSNMEMPLAGWGKIKNYKKEIQNADHPNIRLLQIAHNTSQKTLEILKKPVEGWRVCSPETIANFSSVAYFFARKVYQEEQIPIGLIHSSWGGTVIEAWTSSGALKKMGDFDDMLAQMKNADPKDMQREQEHQLNKWDDTLKQLDQGMDDGEATWANTDLDDSNWATMPLPKFWDDDALPGLDGAVWFRKTMKLPNDFKGKVLTLGFMADDNDKTWINGHLVGSTAGWNTERQYKIPVKWLNDGKNTITIRVFDTGGGGGIHGEQQQFYLKTATKTMSLAGEWNYKVGVDLKDAPQKPYFPIPQNQPTALYNAMINPLRDFKFKGVIWYQGESNADRAAQYETLFPLMINDWRQTFKNPNLPFYFVQLANFMQKTDQPTDPDWARLRNAQFKALSLPHTGMAVTIDIGEAKDIHPKDKQDVGDRLARIALAKTYGEDIAYSGPLYKSMGKDGNSIKIEFDHALGLTTKGSNELKGFSIAGPDQKFHWAKAEIKGNQVIVTSPEVNDPKAVRYDWANNPDGNLYNGADLPASPFKTDDWE